MKYVVYCTVNYTVQSKFRRFLKASVLWMSFSKENGPDREESVSTSLGHRLLC